MNSLRYSIIYAVIRPEISEQLSIGLRGGGAGKPWCSSRGRPGFRGTLRVASRVPSALSTSNT